MTAPLATYRILEVGHMLAAPYAGMLLADLGAEVIKIETEEGDISRHTGSHAMDGHNLYFASLNRGKKSVVLDLTSPEGQESLLRLVRTSHAVLTNLRPDVVRKLGLTYDALRAHNPKIVCMAITGFGLQGSRSNLPAYDYIIQALAGVSALTGDPDGPPVRAGYSVVDNTGGMMAAVGLLAKLAQGQGGQLEVALFDTLLSQLNYLAAAYLNVGEEPTRLPSGGHSYFVPAQMFETSDGYISLFVTHEKFWRIFANELGRPDWLTDERFATMSARNHNRDSVISAVAAELMTRSSQEWVARLQPRGVPIAEVATLADAFDSAAVGEREMIACVPTDAGNLRLVANPIKMQGVNQAYAPPPRLGEHNEALLGVAAAGGVGLR